MSAVMQLAEPDVGAPADPASPVTTDGQPPRLTQTCGLCRQFPLVSLPGSDIARCKHCDTPCPVGPRRGCGACLNGQAT